MGLNPIVEVGNSESAHQLQLKNYIYFSMVFTFGVEMLNRVKCKRVAKIRVVKLNKPMPEEKKNECNHKAN